MRDYKQMTAAVLKRRNAYFQAKAKRDRIVCITLPLACLAAVAIGAGIWRLSPGAVPSPTVISGYGTNSDTCYTTPQPGHWFCFQEVNEARAHYEHRADVTYLLTFDLFDEHGMSSDEQRQAEYKRLSRLGYRFYTSEQTEDMLCLLTEQQLSTFDANEQYGYAFHFAYTKDGTAVDSDGLIPVFYK